MIRLKYKDDGDTSSRVGRIETLHFLTFTALKILLIKAK